jgi:hypothetical protein
MLPTWLHNPAFHLDDPVFPVLRSLALMHPCTMDSSARPTYEGSRSYSTKRPEASLRRRLDSGKVWLAGRLPDPVVTEGPAACQPFQKFS